MLRCRARTGAAVGVTNRRMTSFGMRPGGAVKKLAYGDPPKRRMTGNGVETTLGSFGTNGVAEPAPRGSQTRRDRRFVGIGRQIVLIAFVFFETRAIEVTHSLVLAGRTAAAVDGTGEGVTIGAGVAAPRPRGA